MVEQIQSVRDCPGACLFPSDIVGLTMLRMLLSWLYFQRPEGFWRHTAGVPLPLIFLAHAPLLTPHIRYLETAPWGREVEAACGGMIRGLPATPSPKSLPWLEAVFDS